MDKPTGLDECHRQPCLVKPIVFLCFFKIGKYVAKGSVKQFLRYSRRLAG